MISETQGDRPLNFTSFADWCQHKDSLSEAARHTVDTILKTAWSADINEAIRFVSTEEELNLYAARISDITPLQCLTNLTRLNLCDNQISDLTPLQSLTHLTHLNLVHNQLSNIAPLQSLTHLTDLHLENNKLSDITPLQSLIHLTALHLENNQISDIVPLQSLTHLITLNLQHNQISDITSLQSLTHLNYLNLNYNQISDIAALESLTHLISLNLQANQISNLAPLQSLIHLTDLHLESNQISDIVPLHSLTYLRLVNLYNNQISNLAPLQSLTHLRSLTLSYNQILDIAPLQSLTHLTYLNLYGNQISDITSLQFLTYLTYLQLHNNQISNLTPLRSLTYLSDLNLSDNQISDIAPLQYLTHLNILNLYNNQISDITPLQSLTDLACLILYHNQISDIAPLQSAINISHLYLDSNQISDIAPLQSLTNLALLYLANNQISDITPLQSLANLTELTVSLTPQQQTFIATRRHYWGTLANSTKPIDPSKAANALKVVCEILGLPNPEITFCSSPHAMLSPLQILNQGKDNESIEELNKQLKDALHPFNLIIELADELVRNLEWEEQLKQQLSIVFPDYWNYSWIITPKYLVKVLAMAEFCVSGLSIVLEPDARQLLTAVKQLLTECGWILMYENVCYICDRPLKLSLDTEYRLHAEGESAIEFAGGYKLYSYRGVTLPEKYGEIHPNNWQAEWILEENNAEVRRVLIQGIGYDRICSELQATELDSWQEYALLKIDDADVEPIYLLKMTCPSTGFIHALRVPPDVTSAREAIRWVNWDIEPEEFSEQT